MRIVEEFTPVSSGLIWAGAGVVGRGGAAAMTGVGAAIGRGGRIAVGCTIMGLITGGGMPAGFASGTLMRIVDELTPESAGLIWTGAGAVGRGGAGAMTGVGTATGRGGRNTAGGVITGLMAGGGIPAGFASGTVMRIVCERASSVCVTGTAIAAGGAGLMACTVGRGSCAGEAAGEAGTGVPLFLRKSIRGGSPPPCSGVSPAITQLHFFETVSSLVERVNK